MHSFSVCRRLALGREELTGGGKRFERTRNKRIALTITKYMYSSLPSLGPQVYMSGCRIE